jgi:hypothetical protein
MAEKTTKRQVGRSEALQPLGAEEVAQVEGGVYFEQVKEPISPEGGYTGRQPSAYDYFRYS